MCSIDRLTKCIFIFSLRKKNWNKKKNRKWIDRQLKWMGQRETTKYWSIYWVHIQYFISLCGILCFDIYHINERYRGSTANESWIVNGEYRVADACGTQIYWLLSNKVLNSVDIQQITFIRKFIFIRNESKEMPNEMHTHTNTSASKWKLNNFCFSKFKWIRRLSLMHYVK